MGNNKSTQAEVSHVQLDGLYRKLPGGYANGTYMGDQVPFENICSPYTSIFGGASGNIGHFLSPVDYLTTCAYVNIDVTPGTGNAKIDIGTTASTKAILNDYVIVTGGTTGYIDLSTDATFTGATGFNLGNKGDIICFNTDGGGTATGKAIWGAIIVPRG